MFAATTQTLRGLDLALCQNHTSSRLVQTPAAPQLPEPAFAAVPAPQVQPAQEAKEPSKSAKAKKKAKAKQNAAAAAAAENTPTPTNGAANGKQNGQVNGSTAAKKQPAAKKPADAPSAAKTTTTSRSMPKSAATVASASAQVRHCLYLASDPLPFSRPFDQGPCAPVSYTHLTLPTKRIV